uniref:C2 domain-containing protein n=1 Tax=Macrostomum lignano TaxID=282301 RepID=A0A1I8GBT6_9PLAT
MDLQPDVSPVGQVEVGLEYDRDASELVVSLIQARDLPGGVGGGESEPPDLCAVLSLLPDAAAGSGAQTKLVRRGQNPVVFKERFLYSLEPHQLAQKTVRVRLLAGQKQLGETEVRLADVDLQRPLRLWLNLREPDQKPSDHGELMFSLSYLPTAERLTVVIVKAKNLKWPKPDQTVGDVLVKVHLIQNGKRLAKKKTSVKKNESQPTYNEAMIFNVSQTSLSAVQLRITVAEIRHDGRLASIGHVIIGSQTGGTELTHWQQMVTSLRKPVAMWHHLRKK